LLFALVITRLEPINAQEQTQAITLTVGMILVGMLAGASLAFVTAYLTEQRQNRSDT
jgi:CHASE1-domain containing sensor protein